jgi:hypothetical protein
MTAMFACFKRVANMRPMLGLYAVTVHDSSHYRTVGNEINISNGRFESSHAFHLIFSLPSPCPWPLGRQVLRCRYAIVASARSARLPTQTGLTRCQPALVGTVVAPCYPFSVPVAPWTSSTSLSLRRCRLTRSARPPTQTGLTRRRTALIGTVGVRC